MYCTTAVCNVMENRAGFNDVEDGNDDGDVGGMEENYVQTDDNDLEENEIDVFEEVMQWCRFQKFMRCRRSVDVSALGEGKIEIQIDKAKNRAACHDVVEDRTDGVKESGESYV